MHLPNYKDNSIVNLTASILSVTGKKKQYSTLKILESKKINSKNIVLIILDGLGYEFMKQYKKSSFLGKNIIGKITSVFPPTTAAAITTYLTGKAPGEHGVTGWFVYLKELDVISTILPFTQRGKQKPLTDVGATAADIFDQDTIFQSVERDSYIITNDLIAESTYSRYFGRGATTIPYKRGKIESFTSTIKNTLDSSNNAKFIYAYWSKFDTFSHEYGIGSEKTKQHFEKLDRKLKTLLKNCHNNDTTFLITADHGLIDTTRERTIYLSEHPDLKKLLSMPLSGEPRTAFCFVKPDKEKEFIEYHKNNLKNCCHLIKSSELIKKKAFGLFNTHKNLNSRIGDYILLMKKNYAFKDFLPEEEEYFHVGNHGGVSKEEIYVPLIYYRS